MAILRFFHAWAALALLSVMSGCQPPPSSVETPTAPPPVAPAASIQPVIALFTDFGLVDPYVAQMKGAILSIDPGARLLDLNHDVTPFDVTQGAYLLDQSAQEFPAGTIFVAVVDPQVGTERVPLLVKTNASKFYIGPDNGLLGRVIDREGFAAAWKLDQRLFYRTGAGSDTFHGRDIFGPIAAHLAQGTDPARLGTALPEKSLDLPPLHEPAIAGGIVSAEIIHVDHYGNVILNFPSGSEAAARFHVGNLVKVTVGRENFTGPLVRTYDEGEKGRLILLYGNDGLLEIALNQGSAAARMKVAPGGIVPAQAMTPYILKPICVERPWGGRKIGELFDRQLPANQAIGESWELVDRPEACNDVVSGPGLKAGTRHTLHTLWQEKRTEVFGTRAPDLARFPILIKILDASKNVSVQVHPKAGPGLEPKTEMWYMLETGPEAKIYAGFKKGVKKQDYEAAVGSDRVPGLLHTLQPKPSDAMFLPSGRIHALGADIVILEIQQNSDSTYRIYDWGFRDAQGRERPLHLKEALAHVTFPDLEPQPVQPHGERVLNCPFFSVSRSFIYPGEYRVWTSDHTSFQYHFVAQGELRVENNTFKRGASWLVGADAESYHLEPLGEGAELVTVQWGD